MLWNRKSGIAPVEVRSLCRPTRYLPITYRPTLYRCKEGASIERAKKSRKPPLGDSAWGFVRARQDSNLRPSPPQGDALIH